MSFFYLVISCKCLSYEVLSSPLGVVIMGLENMYICNCLAIENSEIIFLSSQFWFNAYLIIKLFSLKKEKETVWLEETVKSHCKPVCTQYFVSTERHTESFRKN